MSNSTEIQVSSTAPLATPDLVTVDGKVTTTSQQVAQHFGKRHADVMRSIKNLAAELPESGQRNFAHTTIETKIVGANNATGAVRKDPAYRITRDGFTLLAMGFTGKEALLWKLAYIEAFNRMEDELLKPTHDPERIKLAFALSAEVASQASRTVFDAVMAGDDQWKYDRWMFCLNYAREDNRFSAPWAKAIDRQANVMSLERLAKAIVEPGGMHPSDTDLANLAAACNKRLAERLEYQAKKQASASTGA